MPKNENKTNEIKHKVLGVSNETLDNVGAVSQEVARQMAQGVRKLAETDYGVLQIPSTLSSTHKETRVC